MAFLAILAILALFDHFGHFGLFLKSHFKISAKPIVIKMAILPFCLCRYASDHAFEVKKWQKMAKNGIFSTFDVKNDIFEQKMTFWPFCMLASMI